MPQNRVPTNILKLRGADKRNPKRIKERENEPVPNTKLGNPPKALNKEERACWRELVKKAPYGVFGDCDSWEIELAACLMAEYRSGRAAMVTSRLNLLHSILGRFGFTPADRSKISIPKQKKKNPFDEF